MGKILFKNETIIETKHFDVHQDWDVAIAGFYILASKRRISSISEFNGDESKEFMDILIRVRKGMEEVLGIKDVYLFQNEDTDHYFHLWIFPRHDWMEKFGRKIQSVRPIINYAKENMITDEFIKEVKESVEKMRNYFKEV